MTTFFKTAPAASAGVSLARQSELEGLRFENDRDQIYRERDVRRLMQEMPSDSLGLAPLPEYGDDDDLFGDYPQPELYQAEPDAGAGANVQPNAVRDRFMSVVSQTITNPYAQAVVAAYGQHESGFRGSNLTGTWSDPSETGKAGISGGAMSWRNERLQALQQFTGGDMSPEKQAEFFLREDPTLVQKLNAARSVEEANRIMADHIRFAGYNREGGEYDARLRTARSLLGEVQTAASGHGGNAGLAQQLRSQASELVDWKGTKPSIITAINKTRPPSLDDVTMLNHSTEQEQSRAWYNSAMAEEYFNQSPEEVAEAKKDPIGFWRKTAGRGAVGIQERFGEQEAMTTYSPRGTAGVRQQESAPSPQEQKPASPRVSKAIADALGKSDGLMNMELRRARQTRELVRSQVNQQYEMLKQEYARQQQIAEIARRTGSTDLRTKALDRMAELRAQSMELGRTAHEATLNADKQTYSIAADMAIRDLERSNNPARLAHLWRKLGGTNVQVQPRSDGDYNVYTVGPDGTPNGIAVSKEELVNYFMNDVFSEVRNAGKASDAKRAEAYLDAQMKIWVKQMEQQGTARIEHMKAVLSGQKELEGYFALTKSDDGSLIGMAKDGSHYIVVDPASIDEDSGFTKDNVRIVQTTPAGLR